MKDGLVDRVICSLGIAHITEQNRAGVYRFFKRVRSEDLGLAQLALSHADEPNRIFCIGSAFRSREEVAVQNWMTVIAAKASEPRRDGGLAGMRGTEL